MKNKASLLLMEQLVMILVFSLAAALCLQAFAKAAEISGETARTDRAVVLAQNAAELLKASGGEAARAEALSGEGYAVTVAEQPSEIPGLSRGKIQVFYEEKLLFSLETGWQEELP